PWRQRRDVEIVAIVRVRIRPEQLPEARRQGTPFFGVERDGFEAKRLPERNRLTFAHAMNARLRSMLRAGERWRDGNGAIGAVVSDDAQPTSRAAREPAGAERDRECLVIRLERAPVRSVVRAVVNRETQQVAVGISGS